MNSLEPGSHMLAKKTAYLFDTDSEIQNAAEKDKYMCYDYRDLAPLYSGHIV